MDQITNLDNLTLMTRRREFEDGLADFTHGGVFFMIGLLSGLLLSPTVLRLYITALLRHRDITILGLLLVLSLLVLLFIGAKRMVDRFRRNVLWKESGFVKSLRWQVSWQTSLLAGGVVILMILAGVWLMARGLLSQESVLRTIASSAGVATGIVYFRMGNELQVRRYRWVGLFGGLLSATLFFMPISFSSSWWLFGILWMLVLSTSGIWALRQALSDLEETRGE